MPADHRTSRPAARRALSMGAALTATGILHFVRPGPFDGLIPRSLPGPPRAWTLGSGAAELAVGALLLHPRTRRAGGWAAAALFVGVWPGNITMAWRARRASPARRAVALVRLPLQAPLIARALRIAREAWPPRVRMTARDVRIRSRTRVVPTLGTAQEWGLRSRRGSLPLQSIGG